MHANPVTESYRFAQRDSQHILKFTGAFLKEKILQLYSVYCTAGHLNLFSRVRATLPQARTKTVTHGAVAVALFLHHFRTIFGMIIKIQ